MANRLLTGRRSSSQSPPRLRIAGDVPESAEFVDEGNRRPAPPPRTVVADSTDVQRESATNAASASGSVLPTSGDFKDTFVRGVITGLGFALAGVLVRNVFAGRSTRTGQLSGTRKKTKKSKPPRQLIDTGDNNYEFEE